MKRILLSGFVALAAVAIATAGATGAFFSDTETAVGNTFAAGTLDLKIDNESYYNGNFCAPDEEDIDQDENTAEYVWQGQNDYPVIGTSCETSFPASDLDDGLLFFNFLDLKPHDEGEDTISIHVQNDAWACLDMTLTSDDDKSSTEPELESPDLQEDINNTWDGELADTIEMFWWADDGDNVYEVGEKHITPTPVSITDMFGEDRAFFAPLADPENNVWGNEGAPLPANTTVYIAKAWCMGTLGLDPLTQDGEKDERAPSDSEGPGVTCDGTLLGNETQTDSLTLDIAFRAIQSRHNPNFLCDNGDERTAKLTVIKQIVNDQGGNNVVADYQLYADNGTTIIGVTSGIETDVSPGDYTITETGVQGYVASFSGDCDVNGQLSLVNGDDKTCIITNNDLPANITLIKNVINNTNDGDFNAGPTQFGLSVDGFLVQNNTSTSTYSNMPHTINEAGRTGYVFVGPITGTSNYGKACPAVLGGSITLDEGEAITCTITNDDI